MRKPPMQRQSYDAEVMLTVGPFAMKCHRRWQSSAECRGRPVAKPDRRLGLC